MYVNRQVIGPVSPRHVDTQVHIVPWFVSLSVTHVSSSTRESELV